MKREDGYYWIRFAEGAWEIAEWWERYNIWLTLPSSVCGCGPHIDSTKIEVGERIRKRNYDGSWDK